MNRTSIKTLGFALAAALPLLASAQLTGNVSLTTNYKFRGQDQDASKVKAVKPALQGGFDYAHESGFYIGNWNSSVNWLAGNSLESDIYGGYKGTGGAIGYDVGLLHYNYPRHRLAISPNTTEIYGALSYSVVTLKYSHALTNLFGFDDSKGSGYLDLSANFDLGDGWSVVPHVGRQWIRHNSAYAYTDYAVTVNKDFGNGLVASAGVVGTNADKALYVTPSGRFTGRTAVFAAIKYSF